jgi:methyl-accepting chemotaxis protein
LALLIALSAGLAIVLTVMQLRALHSVSGTYSRLLSGEVAAQDQARQVQVAFKIQVQEWKDVLLRGRDSESLAKHRTGFLTQEVRVGALADTLAGTLAGDSSDARTLERFRAAHAAMGVRYREALDLFKRHRDAGEADRLVKGLARASARPASWPGWRRSCTVWWCGSVARGTSGRTEAERWSGQASRCSASITRAVRGPEAVVVPGD